MPVFALLALACDGRLSDGGSQAPGPARADGTWAMRAPVPDARTEVSVTTDGRRIYLIGGFMRAEDGRGTIAPRAMHVYDPETDRWATPDSIPRGVNHAGLVHLDNKLYLVGGFRENTFGPTADVWIYDLATREWSQGAPLPTPRGALAVAVLDGKIHAIGGNAANASGLPPDEHGIGEDGSSVGTHEVYDPTTNRWSRRAPMPTPRNHLGAAVVAGKLHAVGGRVGDDFTLTAHEVYDPSADRWSAAPPVPTGRSGIAVLAHDGHVYVFGGEAIGIEGGTFDEAERFDAAAGAWQSLPPMPTARHGLGAAAVGETVYVLSGGPEPGFAFSQANEALTPARR